MSDLWSFKEFDAGKKLDIFRMKNPVEGSIFYFIIQLRSILYSDDCFSLCVSQ